MSFPFRGAAVLALPLLISPVLAQDSAFVNWENHPVHPVDLSPDAATLAVVNIADARVELYDARPEFPQPLRSFPVGIDPVAVRFRTEDELWVVNHISDSISIVKVDSGRIVATLATKDEPFDVVFAGTPQRAFVTCSQVNRVQVFDPITRTATAEILITGEDPRALAVSPDGRFVYAAVFESGNNTTTVAGGTEQGDALSFPPQLTNDPDTPHAGVNPPPNNGTTFSPALNPMNTRAPRVALIVRKDAAGSWRDDTGADWTEFISGPKAARSGRIPGWDLYDHDLVRIDADSLAVQYARGLMNICMAVGVDPVSGRVAVVGTEAHNEIRYEPILNGRFVDVKTAFVEMDDAVTTVTLHDMNSHAPDTSPTLPLHDRVLSLGDPRGIAWARDGSRYYVTGMGSNNLMEFLPDGSRSARAPLELGEGPIGILVHPSRPRGYVLNRFAGSLSVVDLDGWAEVRRLRFHDATPPAIRQGRRFLYNTHLTSGNGYLSCASCHVDGRMDRLAWDLGDPAGATIPISPGSHNLGSGIGILYAGNAPFHPMKGPMLTQTFQDIIGKEPLHWRGDRINFEAFNGTFHALMGRPTGLTAEEMEDFKAFIATITFPPNPFRNVDNTLSTNVPLEDQPDPGRFGAANAGKPLPNGNAVRGQERYTAFGIDRGAFSCATCHTLPTGAGSDHRFSGSMFVPIPKGPTGESKLMMTTVDAQSNVSMKVPQLRNLYERSGFNALSNRSTAGFGFLHDGTIDSLPRFIGEPAFVIQNNQDLADIVAFCLSMSGSDLTPTSAVNFSNPPGPPSNDTHAGAGRQVTVESPSAPPLLDQLLVLADQEPGRLDLIAKTIAASGEMGWFYDRESNSFIPDVESAPARSMVELLQTAAVGAEITFTATPRGMGRRLGIDRDADGFGDGTEVLAGSNPAEANSTPETVTRQGWMTW